MSPTQLIWAFVAPQGAFATVPSALFIVIEVSLGQLPKASEEIDFIALPIDTEVKPEQLLKAKSPIVRVAFPMFIEVKPEQ